MRRFGGVLLVLLLIAGGSAYLFRQELGLSAPASPQGQGAGRRGGRGARGGGGENGPVSVLAEPARIGDVPVLLEAVGTAQALNTVTVRPQVDGRLLELTFREGQDVRRGDILARIDPTIYQAQYDQALAKKAQDEATLANARLDLERYVNLARGNIGSKQQADTQRATVAQLEAQLKSDQGAIDSAKAYLDYTTVRAPNDGRTGIRLVDAGNLVRAADATGLVVITQLRPISVIFNLPQQDLRAVNAAAARGTLPVKALESDNRTVVDTGQLEVVDNQVDQTTGTVKLKASFPNANLQLWPGSFVNIRMTVDTIRGAVVVPTAAVQRGPNGAFVYGVDDDKAVLKPVTVARQTEAVAVIASGLTPPERVITTGFARLSDGDRVRVADPAPASADAAAPRMRRGEDGSGGRRERRRGRDEAAAPTRPGDAPDASTGAATGPAAATGSTVPPGAAPPATPAAPSEGRRRRQRTDEGRAGDRPGPGAATQ